MRSDQYWMLLVPQRPIVSVLSLHVIVLRISYIGIGPLYDLFNQTISIKDVGLLSQFWYLLGCHRIIAFTILMSIVGESTCVKLSWDSRIPEHIISQYILEVISPIWLQPQVHISGRKGSMKNCSFSKLEATHDPFADIEHLADLCTVCSRQNNNCASTS